MPCSFFIPTKCFIARFLRGCEYLYLGVSHAYRSVTALLGLQVVTNAFDFCEVANPGGWRDVDGPGVGGHRVAAGDLTLVSKRL